MPYGNLHGCHVSTPMQSLCTDRRCWSHQDAGMYPGIYFTAGFGKCTSLLDVNASRPDGTTQQNFVLHKGLDFGKTPSLDFPASEPADPAYRNFQFVAFKKEEGCCLGISLGFRGQCWVLWGQPDLGERSFCPAAPGRHQDPRAVHTNETASGTRRKRDSPWWCEFIPSGQFFIGQNPDYSKHLVQARCLPPCTATR